MPSFKTSAALVATAIFTFGAQAQTTYEIDPNSVSISTRSRLPCLHRLSWACRLTLRSKLVQLANSLVSVALSPALGLILEHPGKQL